MGAKGSTLAHRRSVDAWKGHRRRDVAALQLLASSAAGDVPPGSQRGETAEERSARWDGPHVACTATGDDGNASGDGGARASRGRWEPGAERPADILPEPLPEPGRPPVRSRCRRVRP